MQNLYKKSKLLKKKALRFMLNGYENFYEDLLEIKKTKHESKKKQSFMHRN